jgi:hypothetical protein
VFRILDRAQTGFDLKHAAYDAVRSATSPAEAVASLQALRLERSLLEALTEPFLAR